MSMACNKTVTLANTPNLLRIKHPKALHISVIPARALSHPNSPIPPQTCNLHTLNNVYGI
jgi:hypothetical protein